MNLTINITEVGMHTINYSVPACPNCFNISTCPLPITQYGSSFTANWLFLSLVLSVVVFLMYKYYESPFKAFIWAASSATVLCIVGGLFGWITGLPLVIIVVVLAVVTLWRYKESLGI